MARPSHSNEVRSHSTTHTGRRATVAGLILALLAGASSLAHAAEPTPDLEGRWAQKVVQTSITDVPLIGETTSETITWKIVDVSQDGREVSWSADICKARIDGNSNAGRTVLPDRFARAIPTPQRRGKLTKTDDGEWRFVIVPVTMVMGADLDDPTDDPLPTSPDASSVTDPDGDGHPGATIRMKGILSGRLSIVQRARDRYTTTELGEDRIRGLVAWDNQREILEASNPLLKSNPNTEPHPKARRSHFKMERVDTNATCADVMSQRQTLFGK